jgi:predicted DNA-binding protein
MTFKTNNMKRLGNKDNLFTLRITNDLKRKLQERALRNGTSASAIVNELIEKYLIKLNE